MINSILVTAIFTELQGHAQTRGMDQVVGRVGGLYSSNCLQADEDLRGVWA